MTQTLELSKGQFFTIEAFEFEYEDNEFYEGERCEDVDTYWFEQMGGTLDEYVQQECNNNLNEDNHVMVQVIPRRWATIVDGIPEDYGDDALGIESYIWNGKELVSQEEYSNQLTQTPYTS